MIIKDHFRPDCYISWLLASSFCSSFRLITYKVPTKLGTMPVPVPPWEEDCRPVLASITSLHCVLHTGGTQHLPTHPGFPPNASPMPSAPTAVATAGLPSPFRIIFPSHKNRWTDWEGNIALPVPRSSRLWDEMRARANSHTSWPKFRDLRTAPPQGPFLPLLQAEGSSDFISLSSGCSEPSSAFCWLSQVHRATSTQLSFQGLPVVGKALLPAADLHPPQESGLRAFTSVAVPAQN